MCLKDRYFNNKVYLLEKIKYITKDKGLKMVLGTK